MFSHSANTAASWHSTPSSFSSTSGRHILSPSALARVLVPAAVGHCLLLPWTDGLHLSPHSPSWLRLHLQSSPARVCISLTLNLQCVLLAHKTTSRILCVTARPTATGNSVPPNLCFCPSPCVPHTPRALVTCECLLADERGRPCHE